jgi:hypothetical protein
MRWDVVPFLAVSFVLFGCIRGVHCGALFLTLVAVTSQDPL